MNTLAAGCGAVLALGLSALPAAAQSNRTFVSTVGNDLAACSRTAPCKTFAAAHDKTAAGGEIDCLDAGGFGTVVITKSLTIDCGGVAGSILGSGAGNNNVTINAGTGNVVLRNLNIFGNGALTGIQVTAAGNVMLQNVRINDFAGNGIGVNTSSGTTNLYVRDSHITDSLNAISLSTTSGNVKARIDNTRIEGNSIGLTIGSANVVAGISNSVVTNSSLGLLANGAGTINASRNIIAGNSTGARVGVSGGAINLSQNAFDDNGNVAISFVAGGLVSSAGNNSIIGPPGQAPNASAFFFR